MTASGKIVLASTKLHKFAVIVVAGVVDPGRKQQGRINMDFCKLVLACCIVRFIPVQNKSIRLVATIAAYLAAMRGLARENYPRLNANFAFNRGYQKYPNSRHRLPDCIFAGFDSIRDGQRRRDRAGKMPAVPGVASR